MLNAETDEFGRLLFEKAITLGAATMRERVAASNAKTLPYELR